MTHTIPTDYRRAADALIATVPAAEGVIDRAALLIDLPSILGDALALTLSEFDLDARPDCNLAVASRLLCENRGLTTISPYSPPISSSENHMDQTTDMTALYAVLGFGFLLLLYYWRAVLYIIWSAFNGFAIGAFILAAVVVAGAFVGGKM